MPQQAKHIPSIHVSLLALPEATLSGISGIYDVFNLFNSIVLNAIPFEIQIISPHTTLMNTASGLALNAHCTIAEVKTTDIVIIPALLLEQDLWRTGRYAEVVNWLLKMHEQGATLCSSCSGVLMLAETGLLDKHQATIHWLYERTFKQNFPSVQLRMDQSLVVTGENGRLVMSGASTSWHDLVLYLIAHFAGPQSAIMVAKFFLLQWHVDGQAPYNIFQQVLNHGDTVVLNAQQWMVEHLTSKNPVEYVVALSGLPERSFKRRFKKATGYTPIAYMQNLRIEQAKQRLESTADSFEVICFNIGYEDPAFFRRLFKRTTGLTPGNYRKKFRGPLMALK
ncbi:MAG: GlxA family transcriptional regulator [Gammaproteobacteria bacterium]